MRGNLIFYTSPEGHVSNATPREQTKLRLRFTTDISLRLGSRAVDFEANTTADATARPVVLVSFPMQFGIMSDPTVTLTMTQYNTVEADNLANKTGDVLYLTPVVVKISKVDLLCMTNIQLTLEDVKLSLPANLAYLDLEISGLDTPKNAGPSGEVNVRIMNDLSGTKVWSSYLNLNNHRQEMVDMSDKNNFYHGATYNFGASTSVVSAPMTV